MKRRFTAAYLLVCLLASLPLMTSSGRAAAPSNVYFTAANDHLMDFNAETMPFYSNNVLYISSRIFEDSELGVSYARSTSLGVVMLYTSATDLRFDLAGQTAYDKQGNIYSGYAIEQGGVVFFPLNLVCRYFDLTWTYSETSIAPLIRIKNRNVILSDASFIDAATSLMQLRYTEYERSLSDTPPAPPALPVEPPPVQAAEGQTLYLILSTASSQDALDVLDVLDGVQVTFLLTVSQMEDGNLLRALTAQGHSIALHILGASLEEASDELVTARERLWQSACVWLDLIWYDNNSELDVLLDGQGCIRVTAPVGPPALNHSYTNRTASLLRDIGRYREDVGVYLGSAGECRPLLSSLLAELEENLYRTSAWRLTA